MKKKSNPLKKLIFLVPLLLIFFIWKRNKPEQNFVKVQKGDIVEAIFGVGAVKSENTFSLKVGTFSRVIKRFTDAGNFVKKGEKLLDLENIGIVLAPFSGIITQMSYFVGETIFPQTTILQLVDYNKLVIEVAVDERSVVKAKEGQEAKISFDAYRNKNILGKVRRVYSSEGQFLILVDFDPKELNIIPDMSADMAIKTAVLKDQILVPISALSSTGEVNVLENGQIVPKTIQVGSANDGTFTNMIKGDLKENDELLIRQVIKP